MLVSGKLVEVRKMPEKGLYFSKIENVMQSVFFVKHSLAACTRSSARILLWEERSLLN